MKKRHYITVTAGIAILSVTLGACGIARRSSPSVPVSDSDWSVDTGENSDYTDDVYIEIGENKRSSIFTSPDDYEPGSSERDNEVYAAVNDFVLTSFGTTFQEVDGLTNYDIDVLHTLDNSPGRYGMEYENNKNCVYIFHKNGSEYMESGDLCVGAEGWICRIMDFEHEWAASVRDLNNALRENYPDCSDISFTSTSSVVDAPKGVRDTLAYMDFTVPFYNGESTKVRLYVEEPSETSYVSSDDWAMICLPDEY